MEERQLIQPDLDFVKELKGSGADDLKKCFQCSTCSVVCELSPNKKPFPRKEMIWAGWGLKEKFLGDPDVWLCYQCNDCSDNCPRGAKPGDVMAALRSHFITAYAFPQFLGKALKKPKFIPLLLAFPVVLFLFLLGITGYLKIPAGEIVTSKFVPYVVLDPVFIAVSIFMMVSMGVSVKRFWNDMKKGIHSPNDSENGGFNIVNGIAETAVDIFNHSKFTDCKGNSSRSIGHMLLFFGFAMLFIVTGIVFMGIYIFNFHLPLELTNPVKILANLGALFLVAGLGIVIYRRLTMGEDEARTSFFDWSFIIIILLVTVTGIFTEVFRLAGLAVATYVVYFIHLVTIFYLLAYLPFSKFAHMVYRTTAMIYSKYSGRES